MQLVSRTLQAISQKKCTEWFLGSSDDIVTLYKGSLSPISGLQGTKAKEKRKNDHMARTMRESVKKQQTHNKLRGTHCSMLSLHTPKDLIGPSDYCKMKHCAE